MDKYPIENDWWGEFDDAPPCFYNSHVGCRHPDLCTDCGWNLFVTIERIANKYGKAAVDYLTLNN